MPAVTIDLGDVSRPAPVAPPVPVPVPVPATGIGVALIALVVVFGLAGAVPGRSHLVTPLWTRSVSLAGFTAAPGRLTVSDPGARSLSGRDASTGALRWQVTLPQPVQYLTRLTDDVTGVVLRDADDADVTLLLSGGGAVLGRLPGGQVSAAATTAGLLVAPNQPASCADCAELGGFSAATGRVWWRTLPGQWVPAEGSGLTRFAMVRRPAAVDVRDPATGDLVRTLDLPEWLRGQVGYEVVGQVGETLLAVPSTERPGSPASRRKVYLLRAADGQAVRRWDDTAVVPWPDRRDLALLARQGPSATTFTVLDGTGGGRLVGSVSGADLTCRAAGDLLTCLDPGGQLRTWRLPAVRL